MMSKVLVTTNFIIVTMPKRPIQQGFNGSFPQQMASFQSIIRNVIKNTRDIMELAKAITREHSNFSLNFPEVCIAYILFITLPEAISNC